MEHPPALVPSPPPTEVVAVHQCLMVKKVGKGQIRVHPQGGELLIRLPVELQLIELKPYGSKKSVLATLLNPNLARTSEWWSWNPCESTVHEPWQRDPIVSLVSGSVAGAPRFRVGCRALCRDHM